MFRTLICSGFVILSMYVEAQNKLKKPEWLEGSWMANVPEGKFKEVWVRVSENEWSGKGYQYKGADTVFREELRLTYIKNDLVYTAIVGGQGAVSFRNTSKEAQKFVFENKKHDYPQRIIYVFKDSLTIHVKVQGLMNGKLEEENLILTKVK